MLEQTLIESAMERAVTLAARGPEFDDNPRVGCVLLDPEGRILSEGWHRGAGTPHAEIDALSRVPAEWQSRLSEVTAVVTLEPCNHTGRTGPCAVALAERGIGAVAYALADPGQASSGGADTLRRAGVDVQGGFLAGPARALLTGWLARREAAAGSGAPRSAAAPRPRVTVKWAQTLDGRAAAADGSSQWITGADARGDVHRRRAEADAILVGTGTLLADDPALTARAETGGLLVPAAEQPVPVVMGHRAIPADARILHHPALAAHDLKLPLRIAGDDLAADLATLHAHGVRHLFVEGGPTVASAFLAAGLVDEVLVYIAPALLGGPRLALGDLGIPSIADISRLRVTHTAQLGADLLIKATVVPAQKGN
ncbi:Diaminohydroxyphosphoribosylaminopyrimidine deaminase / 5-amino-6-(5-phosphoribosylamino)uracil reductase [Leucobacter sp. 7(1)]|uniref:bifunctional diaminohydroxyphosphoribosylaminopyrimidine deaminase/5-amino-6-(5-phosphoribosylamino)uracil reductase RibD n=1 Tax=Leucobacter sp. 7(1) TaxID=1255613 RepID=UPI00097EAF48|nr:bifunctional diaminohydroxyphosphoribosylaminopyrimidine deaminase/5-amino-6-(5-phosphoribosylamino)uracil reductase RibD [Leucobacter sp. 7(1)]SJN13461.1 Diaminohydroxyphosphoribosylaminopyrimidine deaminase / 5-amino-6-(5-phosphoribosylamino)uracil reductase [Leucobacter sp. 7(1)]